MYSVKPFTIEGDFFESARAAIRQAAEENGYPPNEVMVHPETAIGDEKFVAVMIGQEMHQIPLRVRDDLRVGFRLADNQGLLDVCDPNSALE